MKSSTNRPSFILVSYRILLFIIILSKQFQTCTSISLVNNHPTKHNSSQQAKKPTKAQLPTAANRVAHPNTNTNTITNSRRTFFTTLLTWTATSTATSTTILVPSAANALQKRNEALCGTGFFTNIAQYKCTEVGDISDEGRSGELSLKESESADSLLSKLGLGLEENDTAGSETSSSSGSNGSSGSLGSLKQYDGNGNRQVENEEIR